MMQQSALRVAWGLQNARGPLPSALQLALLSVADVPIQADAVPSSTLTFSHILSPAWRSVSASASDPTVGCISKSAVWARRNSSIVSVASAARPAAATGAHAIEIVVQGFEKRYVDMACNTLDDLLMLAFAPKSFAALPVGSPSPADAPTNVALGAISRRVVRLPWHRTRFTLLRSPHIDKQGMEQFERREYKTVLTAATNSDAELRRLLEAIKIYQFTGVQIRISCTSAQQVELPGDLTQILAGTALPQPSAAVEAAAAATPVRPPPLPGGGQAVLGSPRVALPAPRSPEALFQEELTSVLRVLRPMVWTGLQARRRTLDSVPEFAAWRQRTSQQQQQQHRGFRPPAPVASAIPGYEDDTGAVEDEADAAGSRTAYGRLLRQRMRQQLELMKATHPASAGTPEALQPAAAASYGLDPAVAADLLARIDAELLKVHEAALGGGGAPPPAGDGFTAAGAAATPVLSASMVSPAEYVYAVLKYAQYVDALYEAAGAAEACRRADAALQLAAPGAALRLLQLWSAATSMEFKQQLGLPPADVEKQILEEQLRREDMARSEHPLIGLIGFTTAIGATTSPKAFHWELPRRLPLGAPTLRSPRHLAMELAIHIARRQLLKGSRGRDRQQRFVRHHVYPNCLPKYALAVQIRNTSLT
ncbi:hypothetical protein VOLCADRAFT_108519 [Volvox carteri f. nagariensis]|uniref:Small ribosomal subunit protein uS10 domain-containing protein n=1 Tax=Volvox carteri f. nagariensis TaxID=3068 RepID=D8UKL5_VOLCA|nr:uncharacterized protein VOLCADRAFT_108519 [Volvox carteri f. nagariensis]EFJ39735.1 hypothetical protein VOLCADRAFT_108519 [Volvox carteri f. nagariensis]|eukprot:XP_002959198.1 hypothetical protein VOLCADRAFT_108519 [Volvox carteri f. nagariensis]